ncbi:hypothetical protein QBC42DRAFT_20111 [Cladorrhinum samala]|uniref:Uncharacterized protein n=1 Tax=Cladorrhinum samala TaxID=585594 RepID=A0AAV9HFX7_9PEZI|nr:hypothetical protein QBC42DRAFT_20111 [Cladorrhinum samala]
MIKDGNEILDDGIIMMTFFFLYFFPFFFFSRGFDGQMDIFVLTQVILHLYTWGVGAVTYKEESVFSYIEPIFCLFLFFLLLLFLLLYH